MAFDSGELLQLLGCQKPYWIRVSGTHLLAVCCAETLPLLVLDLVIRVPIFEGISGPTRVFPWAPSFQLLEFAGPQIKREMLVEDSTWRESSGKGGWNGAVHGVVRV